MESLSEYERSVLMDLELSLLGESSRPLHLAIRREHATRRRQVTWSVGVFLIGVALTTVFLTQSFVLSFVGLVTMIFSSLVFSHSALLARRAAKMLANPRRT